MRKLLRICFFALAIVTLGLLLSSDLKHTIEFDMMGQEGVEEFSVSKNWGLMPIASTQIANREWTTYRFVTYGPMFNLRVVFKNLDGPPRMTVIRSGVIRVLGEKLLNDYSAWCDWLNINSEYYVFTGNGKAAGIVNTSDNMSTLRSGYIGWSGYYQLTGCKGN